MRGQKLAAVQTQVWLRAVQPTESGLSTYSAQGSRPRCPRHVPPQTRYSVPLGSSGYPMLQAHMCVVMMYLDTLLTKAGRPRASAPVSAAWATPSAHHGDRPVDLRPTRARRFPHSEAHSEAHTPPCLRVCNLCMETLPPLSCKRRARLPSAHCQGCHGHPPPPRPSSRPVETASFTMGPMTSRHRDPTSSSPSPSPSPHTTS